MKKIIILTGLILILGVVALAFSQIPKKASESSFESGSRSGSEAYIQKQIIFAPWGSDESSFGLKVTETLVQGIASTTVRYGPTKIEVGKDGNIFILDYFNSRLLKFSRTGKFLSGTTLSTTDLNVAEKKALSVGKFESGYHYEIYRPTKERDRLGLRIIDDKTGKTQVKIDYQGLRDGDTYLTKPLGDDLQGNIYVLVDNTDSGAGGPESRILEVYKYRRDGNLITNIKLSTEIDYVSRSSGQKNKVTVDQDGNIYQLLSKNDGVHLLKWEKR